MIVLPRALAAFGTGLILLLAFFGLRAAEAHALQTGLSDTLLRDRDPDQRDLWLDRAEAAGAGFVRINVRWSDVVDKRPSRPADPQDPSYDFTAVDAGVRGARSRGMQVILTVFKAPEWAEGPNRPASADAGTWKPDRREFGRFSRALAERYSGRTPGLPRVRFFEAWNEPNLSQYLAPQRVGRRIVSPGIYRGLVQAMYGAVHAVRADNRVIVGATSPYGDPYGPKRVRPVTFLSRLFCLSDGRRLRRTRCPARTPVDILSHHPINTSGGPGRSALSPDDASTPDLHRITRVLRAAERLRTIRPARRGRPLWVTEFWWKSNPPDRRDGVSPARQARWLEQSLFSFWRQGVRVAVYMQLRDRPYTHPGESGYSGTGLYFLDGRAKPALRSFRFPFVARRLRPRQVMGWSLAPRSGRLVIELRSRRGWRAVAARRVRAGQVVRLRFGLPRTRRAHALRASLGGIRSVIWRQR